MCVVVSLCLKTLTVLKSSAACLFRATYEADGNNTVYCVYVSVRCVLNGCKSLCVCVACVSV